MMRAGLVSLLLATIACGSAQTGPPEVVLDRSVCAHCTMLISEARYVAAYRVAPGREAKLFDDLGCFAQALRKEVDPSRLQAWLHDYLGERWLAPEEAWIVRSASIATPMGGAMAAVDGPEAAARLASRLGDAEVMRFHELAPNGSRATGR